MSAPPSLFCGGFGAGGGGGGGARGATIAPEVKICTGSEWL